MRLLVGILFEEASLAARVTLTRARLFKRPAGSAHTGTYRVGDLEGKHL